MKYLTLALSALAFASCSSLDSTPYRSAESLPFSVASVEAPASSSAAPRAQSPGTEENYSAAERGDWEITLGGSGSNDNNFDTGGFSLAGSVGYFLTDRWELLVRQDGAYSDFQRSNWNGSTRLALDYHFRDGNLRPFLGLNVGRIYGDTVNDTFAAAPEVGLKWYFRPNVFLNLLAEYQFFFDDGDDINDQFDDGSFVYSVGFGVRL